MGKTKTSQEAERLSYIAKNQLGGFMPELFEQLGLGGDKPSHSSESFEKAPDKPLVIQDPVTGAIELFNAANNHVKSENKKHYAEQAPKPKIEAAIDHHTDVLKSSERATQHEMREVNQRLQEIMNELKRLVSSSKVLQMEFADVSVQQAPTQAGEYHLNFFDWLLLTIRAARQKVEDSGAWLATAKKKGGKKGGYWEMFKKHGTTFGLSNERTVATQTG